MIRRPLRPVRLRPATMSRRVPRGFALLEALLALLLFALGLLAACATLSASLRATHQALLTSRAVDLAADHVEDLHAAPSDADTDALFEAARRRVDSILPSPAREAALELMRIGGAFRIREAP